MTNSNFKKYKTRTATVIVGALLVGLVLLSPTAIMPNVSAQQQYMKPLPLKMVVYSLSSLKPGQVMTPVGPMNASDVHAIPNGIVVDDDAIIAEEGKKLLPIYDTSTNPPGIGAWNEDAYWDSTTAVTSFTGLWTVPSAPTASYSGEQVVYLFPAIQDARPANQIVQPVLQYGFDGSIGGSYWLLSAWNCVGTTCSHSMNTVQTTAGHTIQGSMTKSGNIWTTTATDQNLGQSATMQSSTTVDYHETDVALESANLPLQCSYLPGNTEFTSLTVNNGGLTPNWQTEIAGIWCHMNPQVVSSSDIILHTQS